MEQCFRSGILALDKNDLRFAALRVSLGLLGAPWLLLKSLGSLGEFMELPKHSMLTPVAVPRLA